MGRALLSSSLFSPRLRIPAMRKSFSSISTTKHALGFRTRAALSVSPTERRFPKISAESTGSIPPAELLEVVEAAAQAGSEVLVKFDWLSLVNPSASFFPPLSLLFCLELEILSHDCVNSVKQHQPCSKQIV